jgi:WD40 repeat protein
MEKQKLWLTGGKDNKLRHWSIPLGVKDGELLQTMNIHTDEISDCVEILNPMCVASCSMDRTIVLYDVIHRERLRTINDHHEKGIKHLRYSFSNGGQMISIGSEIYANVWAPESLVSEVHTGRLKGHKKGIIDGTFLGKSPFFATIDETNLVNIFDITTLLNIQTIPGAANN